MRGGGNTLQIVGLQAELVWEYPAANRAAFEKLIRHVVVEKEGVDIVVLPENFTSGFSMDIEKVDNWASGETLEWVKGLAGELDIAIFGSVAFKMEDGSGRNRGLFVKPNGTFDFYDKRHLFTLGGEDKSYVRGDGRVIVEFRGWKILLQICYDLRFPGFSRNVSSDLYDAIIYVANWPEPRIHAWRTLLQARAIENQCYVLGVNRSGEDPAGTVYTGDSLGVGPLGEIFSEGPIVDLKCDREVLDGYRERYPFLKDGE
jgi:predicted amidohydrolase